MKVAAVLYLSSLILMQYYGYHWHFLFFTGCLTLTKEAQEGMRRDRLLLGGYY